ncbi:thiamine phosphate synthase [Pusillimonas sp. CC-YST705]|uniref:Thiamine-phosphate synthase n=1 Tax=Mesopusillimonas faecipullorum TaxID=2755040 RepID=A0ABS8C9E4_9BURK|nr:thiamine phosphate synthase [Mesopusillimonas faecipullorum]MCB5362651.1 thiamine phosphate synthase [Mesopusillimonas faecipullorum]
MITARPLRFPRGLYGITPDWDDTDRLLQAVQAAIRGGMVALQWRPKGATHAARMSQGHQLAQLCKDAGIPFIVNDSMNTALTLKADGVHLGRDDGDPRAARALLGHEKIIGCSCYDQPELARKALAAGADYVAFGAIYPSTVKPDAARAKLDQLTQAKRLTQSWPGVARPAVIAIGGINAANAAAVVEAGADGVALISALFDAPDIEAAARACQAHFAQASGPAPAV